ncbi:unnamed protein product [Urochloa decumbens]|uniref:Exocyst subunit Exo70 family protein n=1 Tax=Urochloa decumbens TaxID=240449 RepID=A0ABC9E1U0_9POAL
MEAMSRDSGRGLWSYRERTGISSSYTVSSSCSSGTLSTAYASSGSRLSSSFSMSMEAAIMHFEEMEKMGTTEFVQPPTKKCRKETDTEKKVKQIKILVKEFFCAPSANCSGDMRVLERWFSEELGVGWVLHLADDAPAGKLQHTLDAPSWIWALSKITDTFCLMRRSLIFPMEEEEQVQFAIFTQQAMLKMLAFFDIIVLTGNRVFAPAPYGKIHILLSVWGAMFDALLRIGQPSPSSWRPSAEFKRIHGEIVDVLSAKKGKAGEAIWSEMEVVRTQIMESLEDGGDSSSRTQSPQGSSDIHKATPSLLSYIKFLQANIHYWTLLEQVVSKYVPPIGNLSPLESMIIGMAFCLEQKLASKSEAFPDQRLRFLFLLNNLHFIRNQYYISESYKAALTDKVEGYMNSYMQVSWAPVLACLFNPTPGCFGKNSSPLPKVESEFRKTYITQKLWKVPDPSLRRRLRKAITGKIISGYTKYIHDNNVTSPSLTPQELEDMLQELFEG